jgi:20S proteasome subunit beta 7
MSRSQTVVAGLPSVVAIKSSEGIVIGANPIATYGSTLYNDNMDRYTQVGKNFVFTASGDYSDFVKITEKLNEMWHEDSVFGGVQEVNVEKYANYTQNLCYQRRCKVDPFLIDGAIAGYDADGNHRLYYVDQFGTFFEKDYVCTGIGNYMLPAQIGNIFSFRI